MSRVAGLSNYAQGWGHYCLYFFAMCALGFSAAALGSHVTQSMVAAASARTDWAPRALSRVEKHLAIKMAAARKTRPITDVSVIALTKTDMPAAELAIAMDRTELATASENTEYVAAADNEALPASAAASTADAADNRSSPHVVVLNASPQVAGIACSSNGCLDSTAIDDSAVEAKIAAVEQGLTDETFAKPYRLGRGSDAELMPRRQKTSRKGQPALGSETAIVKFFSGSAMTMYAPLRVAETPGDIIRRTLNGTI